MAVAASMTVQIEKVELEPSGHGYHQLMLDAIFETTEPMSFVAEINCLGPVVCSLQSKNGNRGRMAVLVIYGDHRPGVIEGIPEFTIVTAGAEVP
ncbi:hypothetical protein [uncultured Nitratireductor sp.]|uniref:hypothetical protein n=1 Tax=uncultured Nitratireductor sp. TaxID=520953 RepID=UPI00260A3B16|nr:hypothetical protein [uncultured Nitratireductor sp.]